MLSILSSKSASTTGSDFCTAGSAWLCICSMSSLILMFDLDAGLLGDSFGSFRRLVLSFLVLGVPDVGFLFSVKRRSVGLGVGRGFEEASFRLEAEDGFG